MSLARRATPDDAEELVRLRKVMQDSYLGPFRERGVRKIDLRASSDGEPLYTSLGFVRTPDPAMRLTL
ncbi:hypothetical protein [Streptomyces sp. SLBN-118]|uniref:hypothetical protein n=1 Tax=Streptomyces sp. SLBN-118 TaxID=2768454 RepID=UPI001153D65B|nr:hypothetical protein [Streptomyces sp. SLBN-118]